MNTMKSLEHSFQWQEWTITFSHVSAALGTEFQALVWNISNCRKYNQTKIIPINSLSLFKMEKMQIWNVEHQWYEIISFFFSYDNKKRTHTKKSLNIKDTLH